MGAAKACITESVNYANERNNLKLPFHPLVQFNIKLLSNASKLMHVRVQLTEQHKTLKIIFNHSLIK